MNIVAFKNKLFENALKSGFEDCEIFYTDMDSFRVNIYKGEIEKYQNKSSSGFGFRGIYNGKMGYYYSELVDDSVIDSVIKNAKENSEILTSDQQEIIFEGSEAYPDVILYDESIANLTVEDKIEMARLMEKTAYDYNDKITAVSTAMISTGEGEVYIANTKGLELSSKSNYIMGYTEVIAKQDGSIKEKGELYIGTLSKFDTVETAKKACKKAVSALCGSSVKSGKYKAVIYNDAFADILGCFVGNFYAENAQKGFSLLKNKTGEKIADSIVTIVDDPLLKNGVMTTAFDSEGVAAYRKNVVENGVLKTLLYNLKSANADGVNSTGNGFKSSFKSQVKTSHTNFYILKGSNTFDELVSEVKDGILITEVTGLHAGANAISGDFSLAAEGFVIKNGKIDRPVEQITAAGNLYNILKSIENVGDDLFINSNGIGSPSVVVYIDIAGEN